MAPVLVWFRQDLRLANNAAFAAAVATGRPVIPVFILDTDPDLRSIGAATRWWLDKSLRAMRSALSTLGGHLILRQGQALAALTRLIDETGADTVLWNRSYDPKIVIRDTGLKATLTASGVVCHSFAATLLNEPWAVSTGDGRPFRVFTAYWRAARRALEAGGRPGGIEDTPVWGPTPAGETLSSWNLHPSAPDWSQGFCDWRPGEVGAARRLQDFLVSALMAYRNGRNIPAEPLTSRLSPHLHFGEISPGQVWAAILTALDQQDFSEDDAEAFLRQLGWRDFNHQLVFYEPQMTTQAFNLKFSTFPWREDPTGFEAWKVGRTGYPMVDAGMRELWSTGWMHNRVRMVVASFLTKHLLINWRDGEAWFWDTLVDADCANNIANWQWVAGCGADAAPYFRIFNPTLQGEKFDSDGRYVRRWVPELAALPDRFIHNPAAAPADLRLRLGIELGVTYPVPIVDHAFARARAIEAHRTLDTTGSAFSAPTPHEELRV